MSKASPSAILLIDHGSRRREAHDQLAQLSRRLEVRLASDASAIGATIVEIAHMEVSEPDIAAGLSACVHRGARHVIAIPCLLSRGRHVTSDIPKLLADAVAQHEGVTAVLAPPLLEHDSFLDLLLEAAASTRS